MPSEQFLSSFFSVEQSTTISSALENIVDNLNKVIKSNNNLVRRVKELEEKVKKLEDAARPSRKLTIEGIGEK